MVPVVCQWRLALLSSPPALQGSGRERVSVGAWLSCPACPLDASLLPPESCRRTLHLTGQDQKHQSATCGNASPLSSVCRAQGFCTGDAGFCLNLPPCLGYLSQPPSELTSGGLRTCSSQAGNGCPQHASLLMSSLHTRSPSPVAVDFKARAPLLWAW